MIDKAAIYIILLAGTTHIAQAQQSEAIADSVKQSLKQLMIQQEIHYSGKNTYTSDVTQLKGLPSNIRFKIKSKNLLRGYVVAAAHPALKGGNCVMTVGQPGITNVKTRRGKAVTEAGVAVCDA